MKILFYFIILMLMFNLVYSYPYNTTPMDDAETFYDYTMALNELSGNIIGYLIVLIVFSVAFIIGLGNGGVTGALLAGSFGGILTATILMPLGLVDFPIYTYMLIAAGVSAFIAIAFKNMT